MSAEGLAGRLGDLIASGGKLAFGAIAITLKNSARACSWEGKTEKPAYKSSSLNSRQAKFSSAFECRTKCSISWPARLRNESHQRLKRRVSRATARPWFG